MVIFYDKYNKELYRARCAFILTEDLTDYNEDEEEYDVEYGFLTDFPAATDKDAVSHYHIVSRLLLDVCNNQRKPGRLVKEDIDHIALIPPGEEQSYFFNAGTSNGSKVQRISPDTIGAVIVLNNDGTHYSCGLLNDTEPEDLVDIAISFVTDMAPSPEAFMNQGLLDEFIRLLCMVYVDDHEFVDDIIEDIQTNYGITISINEETVPAPGPQQATGSIQIPQEKIGNVLAAMLVVRGIAAVHCGNAEDYTRTRECLRKMSFILDRKTLPEKYNGFQEYVFVKKQRAESEFNERNLDFDRLVSAQAFCEAGEYLLELKKQHDQKNAKEGSNTTTINGL